MRPTRPPLLALPVLALAWLGCPAQAADPQSYAVAIAPTGNAALDAALKDSSNLASLRTSSPVAPFGLVTRAQSDVDRFQTALRSFGYYAGHAAITVDGRALDDPALPEALAALPAGTDAKVAVAVDTGPLFHLRHVAIDGALPADARAKLAVKPGDPAIAANVLAGQATLLNALQTTGHALAKVDTPQAVEYPGDQVLDVTYKVVAGPRVDIGAISVDGLKDTNDSYVRRRLLLHPGELYNPDTIEKARQDLASAGIFSSVKATAAPALSPDGRIPISFQVLERPRHAVTFNANYSTDLGITGGVTFTYRNVFGNGETMTASAVSSNGGSATRGTGYTVSLGFVQPDWLRRDQSLSYNVAYIRENLDAYDRKAITGAVTLSRKLTDQITGTIGLSAEQERVSQEGTTRNYTLVGLPVGLTYDSTGPEGLFNPTHGVKAGLTVTPTESFTSPGAFFTLILATASTYINLAAEEGRSVIALRGLVGTAQGATTFQLPPDQRLYAGGSATVRGYKYQSVGPLFPLDSRPVGGVSVDAATVEYRQRIGGSFGAAVFVDAGQVGTRSAPFNGTLFTGAGVGGRYYTPIGPLRVDVAVPLNKRRKDASVELYIGLGQTF